MKPFDLCRAPVGTSYVYDFATPERRKAQNAQLSAASSKVGAKIERLAINGFDSASEPHYLLKVTVLATGAPKKYPRRK